MIIKSDSNFAVKCENCAILFHCNFVMIHILFLKINIINIDNNSFMFCINSNFTFLSVTHITKNL